MISKTLLRKLDESIPHGRKKALAAKLGISEQLLTHYIKGRVINKEIILKLIQLNDEMTNLEKLSDKKLNQILKNV